MEIQEKDNKDENTLNFHKSGNIREVFKSGKFSKINFDISRLSGKGFSNLLQKARNLQELKIKKEKEQNAEPKVKEIQKDKVNDSFSLKIPNNLKMLKKFNLRMSNKKINKNIITSFDTQNSLKEENYYGITTTANSNSLNNCNFNTEKTNNDINESNNEKEKDSLESSSIYNKNMEKMKYSNFYRIFNSMRSKKENKINNLKQRNKKMVILNPDSLYQKKDRDSIEYLEDKNNKNNDDANNEEGYDKDFIENNEKEKMNIYDNQFGNSHSSTEDILHDLENINISLEKNIISINNENSNNSSNLKIFEENKYENNKKEDNNLNIEEIGENFEEENNNISKGIEYETVNNNYSIKKCSTVIEYSFREDQNISYCPLMEDKSKSIENFNNNKNQILFELFDGFKGDEISNFLQQNFTHIYKQYLEETNGNIPRSLVKSFREIDEIIKKIPNSKGKSSTGTVVHIIWENKKKLMVYSGNVGNSKICLVSPEYIIKLNQEQATPESKFINAKLMRKKHNKNNILKRKYEESNEEGKKYKVFGNYKLNEIQEQEQEKERKFGYYKFNRFNYKKNKKENNKDEESDDKLILIPYIAKMEIDLTIKNQYLFLASNGIWNKIDENEMKELTDNTKDTEQLCSNIVKNALYRDTKDNISIFSIKLT